MYIDEQGFCQSRITYEGSSSSNSSVQYGQGEYTTYATSSCNSYQDIYGTWYNTSYITDARGNTTASSSNTECYGCYLGNGGGNFSTSYDGFAPCKCPDGYSVGDNGKDCVWVGNYADAPSQVSNPVSQNILDMYKPTPIDQNSVATPTPTSTNTQADLPVFIIGTPPPGA
jgi:hypothetical protein